MAHLSGNLHTAMDILSNIGHEGSFCYEPDPLLCDTFGKLSISEGIVRPQPNAAAFSHRTANHFLGLRTKPGNRTRQQGHVAARGQLIGQAEARPGTNRSRASASVMADMCPQDANDFWR